MSKRIELDDGMIGEISRVMDPEAVNKFAWRIILPATGATLHSGISPTPEDADAAIQAFVKGADG